MRALVIYESMYGNTHVIADHLAAGLHPAWEVDVVPVSDATTERLAGVDLVLVGGPTHVHGMSSARSREGAATAAERSDGTLTLDPDARGLGLRDWFSAITASPRVMAAAFDTRFDGSPLLTGRASKGIAKRLRADGFDVIAEPESFLVDKQNHLLEGEAERATAWAAKVAEATSPRARR
jgi:hypothetical protein